MRFNCPQFRNITYVYLMHNTLQLSASRLQEMRRNEGNVDKETIMNSRFAS